MRIFLFPGNMCIYINTEFWPQYSFNDEINVRWGCHEAGTLETGFWPKIQYGGFKLHAKWLKNKLRPVSLYYTSFERKFNAAYERHLEKFILMT